ncbi:unnamed protein product, partial [Laminaria digitata]
STLLTLQPNTLGNDTSTDRSASEQESVDAMSAAIARARMGDALDSAINPDERITILSEIYARCEDPLYQASAAYNLGASMMSSGEDATTLLDAIGWFMQADMLDVDPSLRARARYNIGHARYRLAQIEDEVTPQITNPGDLGGMKAQLETKLGVLMGSAGAFRSVHELEPGNTEAIENLERVRREIRLLRAQIDALQDLIDQQQEQERQQQQQQQEAAEKLSELAEQQREESEENAGQPEQSNLEQQQDQSQLNEQTQQEQQNIEQMNQDGSEEMQQIRDLMQEARDAQQQAQEALDQGDQQTAAQEQQRAAEALEQAAEQMQQMAQSQSPGEQGEGEGEGQQAQGEGESEGKPQEEEGDQISEIAKMLLEKERREREA